MNTAKVCIITFDGYEYMLHVDGAKLSVDYFAADYFKKHYLEYGYTVILDVESPEINDRIPVTLTPTADGRIKVVYDITLGKIDKFVL